MADIIPVDEQQGAVRYNAAGQKEKKVYFASGFTQYRPYSVMQTADAATSPAALAPVTNATYAGEICVPQGTTTTTAGWYWAVVEGVCNAAVDGDTTDVGLGDFLEVINAGTAFIIDHATAPTGSAAAVAREANTGAAATKEIYLLGRQVVIAGS